MKNNNTAIFTTANMKIEQFLFAHDIRYKRWERNDDGLTVWVYDRTSELERVVAEFWEVDKRRNERIRKERAGKTYMKKYER